MDFFLIIVGLVCLVFGGDFLVKGAVGLALKTGLSPLVIGMTVVSIGTSSPELMVSVKAALEPGEENLMSIGNIIGSNIANISLVLGVTALISVVPVNRKSIFQDWPVLLLSSIVFSLFMMDLKVDRLEGSIMLVGLIVFLSFMIWKSKTKSTIEIDLPETEVELDVPKKVKPIISFGFLIFGVLGLTLGTNWMLNGAKNIALSYGVSPYIIGVTILAFGTSVPELATSIVAAIKKETDIAVGNLIGSNIFNILLIVGVTSLISPMRLEQSVLNNDVFWMLGFVLILFPIMLFKRIIYRWMGAVLFLSYLIYIYLLIN